MARQPLLLRLFLLALLAASASSLVACAKEEEPPAEAAAPEGAAATAPEGTGAMGPITSRGPMAGGPAAGGGGATAVDFDLPAGWTSQTPDSGMRLAQAEIPGEGGPGQLAVFYFGPGGGGSVEANLQRWVDQIGPEGRSEPRRETFDLDNGLRVTWVEVSGTLQPSTTGMGPAEAQPGARVMAAVVEGPGGPWFFKATGPDATLAAQRDAFVGLLRSVRPRA
jgi:hypothetical protein